MPPAYIRRPSGTPQTADTRLGRRPAAATWSANRPSDWPPLNGERCCGWLSAQPRPDLTGPPGWPSAARFLARIFHSHLGKSREKRYEKRGASTFECVVETTRRAGLETCCDTAGWEACATTWECRRVSKRIVARFQRLIAIMASNPGRCPGLSCGGLSGLVFAPPWAHGGKRSPQVKRAPHPYRPAGRRTVRASGPCHPGLQPLDNAGLSPDIS